MRPPPVIDIHTHYCADMAAMVASARANDIDRVCVSSLGIPYTANPSTEQIRQFNDDVLAAMRLYPELVGFCYLNPLHGAEFCLAELHRCIDAGMRAIKLWVACRASDCRVYPIAREAIRLDLPILQHSFYKVQGNRPNETTGAHVAALACRFPQLRIIMAHLTGNGYRGLLDIKPYPNVFVDTSGGYPASSVTDFAIKALGHNRIIFGSDAPGRNFAIQLARVVGATTAGTARDAILGGTAERLLKL